LLSNIYIIPACSTAIAFLLLAISFCMKDVEAFQLSGAVMTVGGLLLAARKIIRLGSEESMNDEKTKDGGHFVPTPEEIEQSRQCELDIKANMWGIGLLVAGTLIWAFGGIVLRLLWSKV
jgi:drug/metabolite transporter (DMT)-like permease